MTIKNNPLFVDSTKFHGDSIGTQVELKNVAVFEGEELFIVVTNHQGISLKIPMTAVDERTWEARVHLNHQKSIAYHFLIESAGKELFRSTSRRGRAQYAIIENWAPDLGPESHVAPTSSPPEPPAPETSNPGESWTREASSSVRALIDKWGL